MAAKVQVLKVTTVGGKEVCLGRSAIGNCTAAEATLFESGCSCCLTREDRDKVNTVQSAASKEDVDGCSFGTDSRFQ